MNDTEEFIRINLTRFIFYPHQSINSNEILKGGIDRIRYIEKHNEIKIYPMRYEEINKRDVQWGIKIHSDIQSIYDILIKDDFIKLLAEGLIGIKIMRNISDRAKQVTIYVGFSKYSFGLYRPKDFLNFLSKYRGIHIPSGDFINISRLSISRGIYTRVSVSFSQTSFEKIEENLRKCFGKGDGVYAISREAIIKNIINKVQGYKYHGFIYKYVYNPDYVLVVSYKTVIYGEKAYTFGIVQYVRIHNREVIIDILTPYGIVAMSLNNISNDPLSFLKK